jgi:hypothetical protein
MIWRNAYKFAAARTIVITALSTTSLSLPPCADLHHAVQLQRDGRRQPQGWLIQATDPGICLDYSQFGMYGPPFDCKKLRLGRGFMILRDGIRFFIYAQRIFFAIVLSRSFVPTPHLGLTALYITHDSDEFIIGMPQVNVIEHRCYAGHAQSPSERQRLG